MGDANTAVEMPKAQIINHLLILILYYYSVFS
ncbi:hypothetical protein VIBNISOn1_600102 [Vibrio nigripulchritudo SOn1]|uniref:Uncharacterized protein n=1 Tax=Vibrio nigripulchritudo SOn1 TaxID=1238450 RepID=A0AAV2VWD4_9VIBR|nr:hypothetical protein VIBNISFn118_30045 [Vibrio nigripulchritudo SFn118]CCO43841.1 hypothetical protein VIBNISFn135_980311 [Vibrio nigripulchritudo SFn135]CCO48793.1 hypothetical protein VIBNISOn1_600102 [Vibrio nigripulchritudo SOn1]